MQDLTTLKPAQLTELKSNVESELFKRDLKEIRELEAQANKIRARAGLRARTPLRKEKPLK
jgi:hypothetical protein